MAKDTVSSIDLETTTLANVAELLGQRIADALRDMVRDIVAEELRRQHQAGDS